MKTTLLSLAFLSFASVLPAQDNPDIQTSATRSSIAQEEVRKQAEEVRMQLRLLLEDFQQNQMNSPELVQVQQTLKKMANLSDEEILPLVEMLKEAGGLPKASEVAGKLNTASQTQKSIQLSLKTLSDRLALQKNQASMEKRLRQLVLAQAGNLRQTKELAVSGRPANDLPRELRPIYDLSQSSQSTIRQEASLMLDTLEKIVQTMAEGEKSGFGGALDEAKKSDLVAIATSAAQDLSGGKFTEAMGSEGRLLDALQNMLAKIKEDQSVQERMQAMASKLQQLASTESQLAQATEKAESSAQRDLRETQRRLTNEVFALKNELTGLNAAAATQVDEAQKAMEAAEKSLRGNDLRNNEKKDASKAQTEASAKLQAAAGALQSQAEQMAAAAKGPQTAAEALQTLAKLDEQVKDALNTQNALNAAPNAAAPGAQQQLARHTEKLQADALGASPQAAQNLGEAAAQMTQNAASPQAAQSLTEASAQIQAQMAAVQQAMNQQAALQALAAPIEAAKKKTEQAAQGMGQNKDMAEAVKQMMDAQQALGQAQNQSGGGGVPPEVPAALKEAQAQLEASVLQAAQSKGGDAAAANAKAQEAMGQALESLGQAMAAANAQAAAAAPGMAANRPTPGMPNDSGPPMLGNNPPGEDQSTQKGQGGGGGTSTVEGFIGSAGDDNGPAQVATGLKPKDRAAVSQLQKEKAPAEYQSMAQQYLKNLADGVAPGQGK